MKRRYSMVLWVEFETIEAGPITDGRPLREEMEAVPVDAKAKA